MRFMISHDMKIVLTYISVITSTIGFVFLALFLGSTAVICSLLLLLVSSGELKLETRFKIMALVGLYLGILDIIGAILVFAGVLPL
jgi:hypothetical protein